MNIRIVAATLSAAGVLFGNSPLCAAPATTAHTLSAMHAIAVRPSMPHTIPVRVPPLQSAHGADADSDDRATSHSSPNAHSNVQPQIEAPAGHRLLLPWWFRRRHIAAPMPPLV
ncbi:MAG: hypothetical protein JO233_02745 [Candidatus Eremiobacteraeota bacterium]|nr:hypothetical protein [Candidatus Eremiobacteraeota bacterium]